jgi:Ca-activated chloride channel family protein
MLKQIATLTDGEYFRQPTIQSLCPYTARSTDGKEQNVVDSFPVYKELFMKYALIALAALALEYLLRWLVLRRIP